MPTYNYQGRNTQMFARLPGYKNLVAWQAASDLAANVNTLTQPFGPPHWRLSNQMRGATISVSGNIAEGYGSGSLPNYIRYCHYARGSLGEFGSYLQDCEREGLLKDAELARLVKQYGDATYFLERLVQALTQKSQAGSPDQPHVIKEPTAPYELSLNINLSTIGDQGELATDPTEPGPLAAPESPESLESPSQ